MSNSLMGERVIVEVPGESAREGILLNGRRKSGKVQQFTVRFESGDLRTYTGNQLELTGNQAPMDAYIQEGDVLFTKKTLGVCRYIGAVPGYDEITICIEAYDPKLPNDDNIDFVGLIPNANLKANGSYALITEKREIKKIVPPEDILTMLSRIKDKYMELYQNPRVVTVQASDSQQPAEAPPAEPAKTCTIEFQPEKLGIKANWNTGSVDFPLEDNCQAKELGVRKGWQIIKVNGEPYSESVLDEAIAAGSGFELTFDTKGIPRGNPDREEAKAAAISATQGALETGGNVSLPGGMSSEMINELEQLRAETAELKEVLRKKDEEIMLLKHKNDELLAESKELNQLRMKVEQLRNSRKTFSDLVRNLENQKADLTLQLEEKRQAHANIAEELRRLEEENHRLQKKYKKVKRRASKSGIPRNSTMKIMRTPNADPMDQGGDVGAAPDDGPASSADPAPDVKEQAPNNPEAIQDNSEGGPDDGKPEKKKRRGWFGRSG